MEAEIQAEILRLINAAHPNMVKEEDILDELGMYSMEDILPNVDALLAAGSLRMTDKGNDKSYGKK